MDGSNSKFFHRFPWHIVGPFLIVFMLCLINGWFEHLNAGFSPINGTYQNYNVWKRVLNGENIFSDFYAFYGTGQTLIGALATWIGGGTYADSYEMSEFLTMLFFSMFSFAIIYCVVKNTTTAIYATMVIDVINILRPAKIISLLSSDIVGTLDLARWNNNAKMMRAGVVPVMCLISLVIIWRGVKKKRNLESYQFHMFYARVVGALMGVCLLWENCMGVSMYFTFSFLWFILMLKYYHREMKHFVWIVFNYIVCGVICFFSFLAVISKGNIMAFFDLNLPVASDLAWYYNNGPKILKTIDFSIDFWIIAGGILGFHFILRMLYEKDFSFAVRYLLLSSVFWGGIFANYFYAWSSGGSRRDTVILAFIFVVAAYAAQYIEKRIFTKANDMNMLRTCITIFSLMIGFMEIYNTKQANYGKDRGVYFEKLGGYVSDSVADDLQIGEQTIGNGTLFSTYSTAVDVLVDEFQPSGIDYIIHAIGEENQSKYLEAFQASKPDFVQTVHSEYSKYQVWERNQNWFFYKELYKKYVPYSVNSWSIYWRKKDSSEDIFPSIEISTEVANDQESKIIINSDVQEPFIVNMKIKYHTSFSRGVLPDQFLRNMIKITDVTNPDVNVDSWDFIYSPAEGEKEVPITVVNGHGEIVLSSLGGKGTSLRVDDVTAREIFEEPYKYIHCINLTDDNWTRGINNSTGILLVNDNELNRAILINATALRNHVGDIVNIRKINCVQGGYLYIILEDYNKTDTFAYPNMIEVIRE